MNNPMVSVIIPIYNAQNTLNRCIDSVLAQEFTDFELLLMDDGSKDDSPLICDSYAQQDARIRVVHKPNSGVSDTRNQGIALAQGKYLQFIDADDWLSPIAMKLLVRSAEEHECDLVISDFYRVVDDRLAQKGDIEADGVLTQEEFAAFMMENPADFYYGVLWNKLFRRDLIVQHDLRMDTAISWCEDFLFNLEYIRLARRFYALRIPIYYYVRTKGSLASQGANLAKSVRTKLMLFEYYNDFYRDVLDERDYQQKKMQVYSFLIQSAKDGAVPPIIFPSAKRLGDERINVQEGALGAGLLLADYRERKLLESCLQPVALKHDLSQTEVALLLYLSQNPDPVSSRELAEYTDTPLALITFSVSRLRSREYIAVTEHTAKKESAKKEPRRNQFSFLPGAEIILRDIQEALGDLNALRFEGLSPEERESYLSLQKRVEQNVINALTQA